MIYGLLADAVLVLHLGFILFVGLGGLLAIRWRNVVFLHLPCAVWGLLIELFGWICPLTPLENSLRRMANEAAYGGGFIEHYLLPVIYPGGLTREIQFALAALVVVLNAGVYFVVWRKWRSARGSGTATG